MALFSLLYVIVCYNSAPCCYKEAFIYTKQSENTKILVINHINHLDFNKYKDKVDFWTTLGKQLHDRLLHQSANNLWLTRKQQIHTFENAGDDV